MAGKSPSQRRSGSGKFYRLFAAGEMTGRVVRFVTPQLAAQRVAEGKWREVHWADDETFAGYQSTQEPEPMPPKAQKSGAQAAIDMAKEATITLAETRRNAGEFGESRTAGMPEWKRERRQRRAQENYRRIVALEDSIERAIEKVKQWPYPASVLRDAKGAACSDSKGRPIFGDKAIRVYPPAPRRKA